MNTAQYAAGNHLEKKREPKERVFHQIQGRWQVICQMNFQAMEKGAAEDKSK